MNIHIVESHVYQPSHYNQVHKSESWDAILTASPTTIEVLYWFILTSDYSLVSVAGAQWDENPKNTAKLKPSERWANVGWILVRGL